MATTAKRALVLSRGGAKGAYEVGVLAACQHTGLTFDVITGASNGAINAVRFAEYLRRRQRDPDDASRYFNYVLGMWEHLDVANLVDSDQLELLIRDLAKVQIALDDVLHIMWGLTDPSRLERFRGGWHAFWAMTELDDILPLGLRDFREFFELWQADQRGQIREQVRAAVGRFLARHNAQRSLLSVGAVHKAMGSPYDDSGVPPLALDQRLSSFREAGVDVRLTRTNVRSGQLETSAHFTLSEVLGRPKTMRCTPSWQVRSRQRRWAFPPNSTHSLPEPILFRVTSTWMGNPRQPPSVGGHQRDSGCGRACPHRTGGQGDLSPNPRRIRQIPRVRAQDQGTAPWPGRADAFVRARPACVGADAERQAAGRHA